MGLWGLDKVELLFCLVIEIILPFSEDVKIEGKSTKIWRNDAQATGLDEVWT